MGIYIGIPENDVYERITYNGEVLKSDEQLNWGYFSGGPMETANLILKHHLKLSKNPSVKIRDSFTQDIISKFGRDKQFELTSEEVQDWCHNNINIINLTCNDLSITIEELSEAIGYETKILNDTINDNITITKSISKAVELYRKNLELEKKLKESENIKSILKRWLI